jgi:hypothetical protein
MVIKFFGLFILGALLTGAVLMPRNQPAATTIHASVQAPGEMPETPSTAPDNPVELGNVHWQRDLATGKALSESTGKPLLILFQEVPGCSNCTQFGSTTLSHPLIVEAIESLFVPVCIYNNKGGKDGEALQRFDEPAWNNPVVRLVRTDYSDLIPRIADFRSSTQLVAGMLRALDLAGVATPRYLELLDEELRARAAGVETATFSMYCFWTGEGTFGDIPGVVETQPGFQDGKEVVKVVFDPSQVSREKLASLTQPKGFATCAKNDGFRTDHEPKYYLLQTPYRYVPMTSLQASRANSLVGKNKLPDEVLSPRQLALLENVKAQPDKKWKNMIGRYDLIKAWSEI